ncbi:hypothetical protein OOZ63_24500 [Paucibacter sp. PLA-PC-4]|uniref:hypothetical protein n=1 Tax=Paucibacter sp. PLA-PC-4 TaxID=2993655 RepID=UPI00224AEFBF|nr:hypothetical protein [Paucibacter sp. PLA-PC-4]MCX2864992.1 hypothetical protein [Paucibacter sp. PLA-PC-4]
MKIFPTLTLLISLASAGAVMAQSAAPAAAKPASKQAVKKTPVKPRGKPAVKPVPPPPPPLADASEEQLAATERAYLGTYDCEFKQSVSITRNTKPGYLDVMWQKDTFTMKPVLSSTGALRLEDVTGRTLMIQIANKSMLMDTHIGRRLVDECLHPEHRAAIEAAKIARAAAAASAAASGLEVEADASSLGIAPSPAKRGS